MRKSKKTGDHEEFNIWQPAADMMTALLFIALLIILLLGLYLVYRPNTSGNGKYNHEGAVTADTEEDDDDTATTNKQEEQTTGGGGGDQEDEFPIQIPSGGGGGTPEDEGIKTAVYAELIDGVVSLKRLLNQSNLKSWSSKMIKKSLEAYFFTLKNKIVFCKNNFKTCPYFVSSVQRLCKEL